MNLDKHSLQGLQHSPDVMPNINHLVAYPSAISRAFLLKNMIQRFPEPLGKLPSVAIGLDMRAWIPYVLMIAA